MPLLLIEALAPADRETTHAHIEHCADCEREWSEYRDTWRLLGEVPDVPVPSRVRSRFFSEVEKMSGQNIVPFERKARPARRWLAQAAAAVILVSGSFFAGRETLQSRQQRELADAVKKNAPFRIAESMVVPASSIEPDIVGRPEIRNISFNEPVGGSDAVGMSFDMTSRVTVTGRPHDKSFVKLLSYVMQDRTRSSHLRSATMQWVKNTYAGEESADPVIVEALANVLKNETHEGVRLKAAETLRALPSSGGSAQAALIEALRNDPNPAVRIKAVEALAALTHNGNTLDAAAVDTLRQKAGQEDENPYVRVKAAEALSRVNL